MSDFLEHLLNYSGKLGFTYEFTAAWYVLFNPFSKKMLKKVKYVTLYSVKRQKFVCLYIN